MNKNEVAFDTETTSLRQDELEITGISFSDGVNSFYAPVHSSKNVRNVKCITSVELNSCLYPFFKSMDRGLLIAHNWVFDARVIGKNCYDISKINRACTLVADHLIDETRSHKLKDLVNDFLGLPVVRYGEVGQDHYSDAFYHYGLDDAVNTWILWQEQKKLLASDGLEDLFWRIEMPFQNVLLEMALEGVLIDQELMEKTTIELKKELNETLYQLCVLAGVKYEVDTDIFGTIIPYTEEMRFFKRKPAELRRISYKFSTNNLVKVFNSMNIPIKGMTPKGNPSVGKETMEALMSNDSDGKLVYYSDFIKYLYKYKKISQLLNLFFLKMPDHIQKDGKMRSSFKDTGTKTGRLSSSKMNLQQLAKVNSVVDANVRECFVAPESHKMFSVDYSGQEVVVMAQVSKDPTLVKALKNGYDMHLAIANQFYKLGIPDVCLSKTHSEYNTWKSRFKKQRSEAKTITFGLAYGKAQTLDSKILTPNGWITFDTVKEGDKVFAANGTVTTVTRVHPIQKQATYEVTMRDGSKTKCGKNHLWTIQTLYDKPLDRTRTIPTHKLIGILKKGGQNNCFIQYNNPLQFDKKNQWLHPYLMGLYLGDGDSLNRFTIENKGIIKKVKGLIPTGYILNKHSKYHYSIINGNKRDKKGQFVKSNKVISYMRSMGLEGKRAWEKHIPLDYLYGNYEQRSTLFYGLFDSDGSFNNNSYDYTTTSKKLSDDISFLVKSLGGRCSMTPRHTYYIYNGEKRKGRLSYRLFISFPPTRVDNSIKSIKYIGEYECRCITIDKEDGLYITDDFIVTHNSAYGFAKDFGIEEDEAQKIVDDYFDGMPKLLEAIKESHREVEQTGTVTTLAGRKRHFHLDEDTEFWIVEKAKRQSFNFKIQSFSADMIRAASVTVHRNKVKFPHWDLKAVMTVHDEFVYTVRREFVGVASKFVKKCFENVCKNFVVPIEADIEIGENYGNSK